MRIQQQQQQQQQHLQQARQAAARVPIPQRQMSAQSYVGRRACFGCLSPRSQAPTCSLILHSVSIIFLKKAAATASSTARRDASSSPTTAAAAVQQQRRQFARFSCLLGPFTLHDPSSLAHANRSERRRRRRRWEYEQQQQQQQRQRVVAAADASRRRRYARVARFGAVYRPASSTVSRRSRRRRRRARRRRGSENPRRRRRRRRRERLDLAKGFAGRDLDLARQAGRNRDGRTVFAADEEAAASGYAR